MKKHGLTQSPYHIFENAKYLCDGFHTRTKHPIVPGKTVVVNDYALIGEARREGLVVVNYGRRDEGMSIAIVFKTEAQAVYFKLMTNGILL